MSKEKAIDRTCNNCAYRNTQYCLICVGSDMHKTQEEKKELEAMCDLMCGEQETF